MPLQRRFFETLTLAIVLLTGALCFLAIARAQNPPAQSPIIPENAVKGVSEHVYAILAFPNIEIVVGNRATLVVDTGMGPRNGATIMREVEKLAKSPNLYLTTTHYHPEHAAGEQGFPPRTVLIRPAVQQQEMDARGAEFIETFRSRSAVNKELLQDVKLRPADIVFDQEVKLDLGGVTARLFWLGAAHTKGDELIFVEPDRALISGDIVQNKLVPGMPNADASVKGWLAILDKLEPLKPRFVLPDHGPLGDGSLIAQQRGFMMDLQARAVELKRQGKSADEAERRSARLRRGAVARLMMRRRRSAFIFSVLLTRKFFARRDDFSPPRPSRPLSPSARVLVAALPRCDR